MTLPWRTRRCRSARSRPGEADAEQRGDDECGGAAERRRRGLHDLERGWQKREFFAVALILLARERMMRLADVMDSVP